MKKKLSKRNELYYFNDGINIEGANPWLRGNFSGISGDCTGLSGNFDDCEITGEERAKGINISTLIEEK